MILAVSGTKGLRAPREARGGVYAIRNLINGKVYVGSALDFRARWSVHVTELERGYHRNLRLLNAWRKHGRDAFAFEVLEVVENPAHLLEREQAWLDSRGPADPRAGYNMNPTAGSNLGRTFGAEVRSRIAEGARRAMADPEVKARHREATRAGMERARLAGRPIGRRPASLDTVPRPEAFRVAARARAVAQLQRDPETFARFVAASHTPEVQARRTASVKRARERELAAADPVEFSAVMAARASKAYTAYPPQGEPHEVRNLKRFCRANGLTYSLAIKVLRGDLAQTKGWRFVRPVEGSG